MGRKNWRDYKLIMFDVDGTISSRISNELLPEASMFFTAVRSLDAPPLLAFVTNQGGVGYRHQLELEGRKGYKKYPTQDQVELRLGLLASAAGVPMSRIYVAYAFRMERIGIWTSTPIAQAGQPQWSRNRRKPNAGMLLQAMADADVLPKNALMVGDSIEDRRAAGKAKVEFAEAKEFFRELIAV